MKRPNLKIFLLTALMIFSVSQEGNGFSVAPTKLEAINCYNGKCQNNMAPRLKWKVLNNSYFEVQIFFYGTSIPDKCGDIITKDSSFCDKSITTTPYLVPIDILESNKKYKWRVRALNENGEEESPFSDPKSFSVSKICMVGTDKIDMDCDGIPDIAEKKLGTQSDKKTLFVKPIDESGGYWAEFINLFKDDSRPGFAKIPQFEDAGIEVVVIGAPGHDLYKRFSCPVDDNPSDDICKDYSPLENYSYNPSVIDDDIKTWLDSQNNPVLPDGKLPCDIMIIKQHEKTGSLKNGHTYLGKINTAIKYIPEAKFTWSWDIRGRISPDNCKFPDHCYGIPIIYTYPLDMYFKEGAYETIKIGQPSINSITHCDSATTGTDCTKLSPLNLKDEEELHPPLAYSNNNSDTVEFSPFGMDGTGEIIYIPSTDKIISGVEVHDYYKIHIVKDIDITNIFRHIGASVEIAFNNNDPSKIISIDKENDTVHKTVFIDNSDRTVYIKSYSKEDVKRKTIVHEMGHALMLGDDTDHCSNPQCVMYGNPIDWEPSKFGGPLPLCEVNEKGEKINCCEHRKRGSLDIRAVGRVYNSTY